MGGMIDGMRQAAGAAQSLRQNNPLTAAMQNVIRPVVQPAAAMQPQSQPNVMPTEANPTAPSVSGGAVRGTRGSKAEQYAYNYYLNQGLPPAMAAGLVGNAMQESAFRGDVLSGRTKGDAGASGYAFQWQGKRQKNLMRFAQSRGETQPSLDTQLQFALEEGNPASPYSDPGAVKAVQMMRNAKSPEEAAIIFRNYSERPSAQDHSKRAEYARRVFGGKADPNMTMPEFNPGPGASGNNPIAGNSYNSRMFGDSSGSLINPPDAGSGGATGGGRGIPSVDSGQSEGTSEAVDTGAPLIESAQQQIATQTQQPNTRAMQRKEELRKRSHSV